MKKPAAQPYIPAPWEPPHWELADAAAIQALHRGDASSDQQRRALDFIINAICKTYDWPYRPGGPEGERDTNVALGMMRAGQQVVFMTKVNLAAIKQAKRQASSTQETGK